MTDRAEQRVPEIGDPAVWLTDDRHGIADQRWRDPADPRVVPMVRHCAGCGASWRRVPLLRCCLGRRAGWQVEWRCMPCAEAEGYA